MLLFTLRKPEYCPHRKQGSSHVPLGRHAASFGQPRLLCQFGNASHGRLRMSHELHQGCLESAVLLCTCSLACSHRYQHIRAGHKTVECHARNLQVRDDFRATTQLYPSCATHRVPATPIATAHRLATHSRPWPRKSAHSTTRHSTAPPPSHLQPSPASPS